MICGERGRVAAAGVRREGDCGARGAAGSSGAALPGGLFALQSVVGGHRYVATCDSRFFLFYLFFFFPFLRVPRTGERITEKLFCRRHLRLVHSGGRWPCGEIAAPRPLLRRPGPRTVSGGRPFPAARERGPLRSLVENKEPAGPLAPPEPGNGRRPARVGEGEAARRARSRRLHAAGQRLLPAGGALALPQPFCSRRPCWERSARSCRLRLRVPLRIPPPVSARPRLCAPSRRSRTAGDGALNCP